MTSRSDNGTSRIEAGHLAWIKTHLPWVPDDIRDPSVIPCGDMPGDKVVINSGHVGKAEKIFPRLLDLLLPVLCDHPQQRAVLAVCGGSGVGKSEIASLISFYLNRLGIGCYTLSGDNYPHRIPKHNDAERLRIFRSAGVRGLITHGRYTSELRLIIKGLQTNGDDYNPAQVANFPWLSCYQNEGRNGLKSYLGTTHEIDFAEISGIISQFKNGAASICLKRMGREETDLWYEPVDFSGKQVLIIEWTHGNSDNIQGVDIPILLNSTPQETLEHRRARNRDGAADSPFTTLVLSIEQSLLVSQAAKAKLIVSKSGEILSYGDYMRLMIQD